MSTVYGDTFLLNFFNNDCKISKTSLLQSWNYNNNSLQLSNLIRKFLLQSLKKAVCQYYQHNFQLGMLELQG